MPINRFQETIQVTDKNLVACLLTCGAPLVPNEETTFLSGDEELIAFNFLPVCLDGTRTEDLITAWVEESQAGRREDEFSFRFPDHPMSQSMLTIHNRIWVNRICKDRRPSVVIRKGSSVALLSPAMARADEDHILGKIGV